MFSIFKWVKIIFYMLFYYLHEKDIKTAMKKFSLKAINICNTKLIIDKPPIDTKNFVIMASHKSYFDIFCIECSFIDIGIIWFAKKELFKIPIYGNILKKSGALSIERDSVIKSALAIRKLLKSHKNNVAFAIFPYGTRKNTLNFKNGGIYFAKKLNLPIIPVRIEASDYIMPPGKFTINSGTVHVKIFDKIEPNSSNEAIEERLKAIL